MKKKDVSAMESIVSQLDVTQIFGDFDDFYCSWERLWQFVRVSVASDGARLNPKQTRFLHQSICEPDSPQLGGQ